VPVEPFRPVLRAALLTGGVPEFFRSAGGADDAATTGYPLWTTPGAKVASGSVAPFLAETLGGLETATPDPLEDRPAPADAGEGRDALRLLLAAAEHDAEAGDPERALAWLHVVELLDLAIPTEYVTKRDEWRRRLDPARAVDPAAGRIDPSLRGMDHALSDLERRVGWLRHMEARGAADMGARLREFDRGLEQLRALTRKTGILR
jgi:hypothetical protein